MPAPSPLSGSQPHPPRWFMFSSISRASETILLRRLALDVADEADAAGVVLVAGVVQALGGGSPFIGIYSRRLDPAEPCLAPSTRAFPSPGNGGRDANRRRRSKKVRPNRVVRGRCPGQETKSRSLADIALATQVTARCGNDPASPAVADRAIPVGRGIGSGPSRTASRMTQVVTSYGNPVDDGGSAGVCPTSLRGWCG